MTLAPIIVFAYNRADHLRKTLTWLGQNELANESTRYIFCDGPKPNATDEQLTKVQAARKVAHTYGIENDFNEQFAALRVAIIDDRCLCMPELDEPNSTGDLALYSMCSKKQVDLGAGGIGYVADDWNYEEIMVPENDVLTNETWTLDIL